MINDKILIDVLVTHTGKDAVFTYCVPDKFASEIVDGLVVVVPIRNRKVYGVVWRHPSRFKSGLKKIKFKEIIKIVDPDLRLTPYQKDISLWMSDQLLAPLSDCIFSFLPILKKRPGGKNLECGMWNVEDENSTRISPISLTSEQHQALEIIQNSNKPILLHGITGSGKTEVYLRYAESILKTGKQVVILVPEIALTPQTKKRFTDRFGDIVTVWHSELSMAERRLQYWQIRLGQKRLVVGSRSALFLPFTELGLIVIDEEHEKSFFQESSPRYNTVNLSEKLAELTHAKLILGSATPSLESVWKATTGQYNLAKLVSRATASPLPESVIIDLRQERMASNSFISMALFNYMEDALNNKRQVVLLLNRRGHSTSALCTSCGLILMCKHCNVPLTIHFAGEGRTFTPANPMLICHHCNYSEVAPTLCPICHNASMIFKGIGTEKVENELKHLFPTAKILRMDRDTTTTRDIIDKMYHDFAAHKYDILIGTQMIAKGWDIPTVDVVGILLAESGLMMPDFHAAANTLNLLIQVAGRSGRGTKAGLTVIQTYQPDHPLIRSAATHDFGQFVKEELKSRRQFNYPPFSHIIRVLYQHRSESKCQKETTEIAQKIDQLNLEDTEILGPAPCFFERLRGKYRYHVTLKIKDLSKVSPLKSLLKSLSSPWVIEIDPPQLL